MRFRTLFVYIIVAAVCAIVTTSSGCKKYEGIVGEDGSPSNVIFPSSNVSYAQEVQRLFNQTCAIAGCHMGSSPTGRLSLESWSNARFDLPGVIVAGSPETSTMVLRIEGRVSQRMPLYRNPLNQNQINGIRAWIAEGALNN
ncbi:MAG: hypothetical protein HY961_03335 [Ignavibacteriae bacterium]|nr:hypothetical protein [Ignavibacteriota bacterium]